MDIMMSIKPEYAERILNGSKRWEFRKSIPKDIDDCNHIYVYATAPVKKVVCALFIGDILYEEPSSLYELTKNTAGIGKDSFMWYFRDCKKGYAIGIRGKIVFDQPKDLSDFGIKRAPQSWCYVKGAQS